MGDEAYYADHWATIYHGDCREILPSLGPVGLVLTDPPYGIDVRVDSSWFSGGSQTNDRASVQERIRVHGDTEPFDPRHLLQYPRLVLFGAQNFAQYLPPSNGWLVWDKRWGLEDIKDWPLGEGELAWTNVTGAVRFFRNRWMGLLRSDERGEHYHPLHQLQPEQGGDAALPPAQEAGAPGAAVPRGHLR